MKQINLYRIMTYDDVVRSINENLDYLFTLILELKYMVGFSHMNQHHPDMLEKRMQYIKK